MSETCTDSTTCGDGGFCNFDSDTEGFCEYCKDLKAENTKCEDDGLDNQKGEDEAARKEQASQGQGLALVIVQVLID